VGCVACRYLFKYIIIGDVGTWAVQAVVRTVVGSAARQVPGSLLCVATFVHAGAALGVINTGRLNRCWKLEDAQGRR
jgi:hypothetical protein